MHTLLMAIAPVAIILTYIYFRDKYEKEPIRLLLKALFLGALIVIPILYVESTLMKFMPFFESSKRAAAFYNAFVVAGFSEELFKFLAFYFLIWKSKDFDERFDGIVYAVFISLGFAMIENIEYVYSYGEQIALSRAILVVPAHALFGVTMGYYFSLSKFSLNRSTKQIYFIYALVFPIILHGSYDFILMADEPLGMLVFIPYIIYLWRTGFKKIRTLLNESRFKN